MSDVDEGSEGSVAKEIILSMDDDAAAENVSRYMEKLSLNRRESRKWRMKENYLYQAIRKGEDSQSLADAAINVDDLNISHFDGHSYVTFLTLALEFDNLKAFKLLIDMGCDAFWVDPKGVSLFHHLGFHGGLAFVLAACKGRSPGDIYHQVRTIAKDGRTPALVASTHGHLDVLEFLVDFGADVTRGRFSITRYIFELANNYVYVDREPRGLDLCACGVKKRTLWDPSVPFVCRCRS